MDDFLQEINVGPTPRTLSRASTRSDLSQPDEVDEHVEVHVPPPARAQDRQEQHIRRIKKTPVGAALLPIIHSLFALASEREERGEPQMEVPDLGQIAQLLEDVPTTMAAAAAPKKTDVDDLITGVIDRLIIKPPASLMLVEPPTEFASHNFFGPTKSSRFTCLKLYFPQAIFNGNGKDKNNIVDHLQSLTDGFNAMGGQLSKADVTMILKSKFGGYAYSALCTFLANENYDLKAVYGKMLATFDNRESPEEAIEILSSLQASQFSSLHRLLLRVESLGQRAALTLRGKKAQKTKMDDLTVQTVLRMLPSAERANIISQKLQLESATDEALTFATLSAMLSKHAASLNAYFKRGYKPKRERERRESNDRTHFSSYEANVKGRKNEGERESKQEDRAERKRAFWRNEAKDSDVGRPKSLTQPDSSNVCLKCKGKHETDQCFIPGQVGARVCSICNLGMMHYERFCPYRLAKQAYERFEDQRAGNAGNA
jgi:hypothetical protein